MGPSSIHQSRFSSHVGVVEPKRGSPIRVKEEAIRGFSPAPPAVGIVSVVDRSYSAWTDLSAFKAADNDSIQEAVLSSSVGSEVELGRYFSAATMGLSESFNEMSLSLSAPSAAIQSSAVEVDPQFTTMRPHAPFEAVPSAIVEDDPDLTMYFDETCDGTGGSTGRNSVGSGSNVSGSAGGAGGAGGAGRNSHNHTDTKAEGEGESYPTSGGFSNPLASFLRPSSPAPIVMNPRINSNSPSPSPSIAFPTMSMHTPTNNNNNNNNNTNSAVTLASPSSSSSSKRIRSLSQSYASNVYSPTKGNAITFETLQPMACGGEISISTNVSVSTATMTASKDSSKEKEKEKDKERDKEPLALRSGLQTTTKSSSKQGRPGDFRPRTTVLQASDGNGTSTSSMSTLSATLSAAAIASVNAYTGMKSNSNSNSSVGAMMQGMGGSYGGGTMRNGSSLGPSGGQKQPLRPRSQPIPQEQHTPSSSKGGFRQGLGSGLSAAMSSSSMPHGGGNAGNGATTNMNMPTVMPMNMTMTMTMTTAGRRSRGDSPASAVSLSRGVGADTASMVGSVDMEVDWNPSHKAPLTPTRALNPVRPTSTQSSQSSSRGLPSPSLIFSDDTSKFYPSPSAKIVTAHRTSVPFPFQLNDNDNDNANANGDEPLSISTTTSRVVHPPNSSGNNDSSSTAAAVSASTLWENIIMGSNGNDSVSVGGFNSVYPPQKPVFPFPISEVSAFDSSQSLQ
jgi:hypothetical protein